MRRRYKISGVLETRTPRLILMLFREKEKNKQNIKRKYRGRARKKKKRKRIAKDNMEVVKIDSIQSELDR